MNFYFITGAWYENLQLSFFVGSHVYCLSASKLPRFLLKMVYKHRRLTYPSPMKSQSTTKKKINNQVSFYKFTKITETHPEMYLYFFTTKY